MLQINACFLLIIIYILATPSVVLNEELAPKDTVIANNGSTEIENTTLSSIGNYSSAKQEIENTTLSPIGNYSSAKQEIENTTLSPIGNYSSAKQEIENTTLSPIGNYSSTKQATSKNLITTVELEDSNKTKSEVVTPEYLENVNITKENYTEISDSENVNSTDSVHVNDTDFQSVVATEEKNENFINIPDENITSLIDYICPNFISSNDYVDRMIEKITENISGEIPLPNLEDKLGHFTFTGGKLRGLKYMKRIGDAKVTCGPPMTLEARLRFEELTVKYIWHKKNLFSSLRGRVFLVTNETDMLFGIKQNGSKAYLDKFMIKDIKGIKTEVTGMSYITWALSQLISPVINIFRQTMGLIITGPFREAFAQQIENMDFPYI